MLISHHNDISQAEINQLRNSINNVWRTIYEYLGKNPRIKLEDDAFLKDHWIMYFGFRKEKAEEFAEFLLSEYFITKRVISKELSIHDIYQYIQSLQNSIKKWYGIKACSSDNEQERQVLERLNVLGIRYFTPLILAAYSIDSAKTSMLLQ